MKEIRAINSDQTQWMLLFGPVRKQSNLNQQNGSEEMLGNIFIVKDQGMRLMPPGLYIFGHWLSVPNGTLYHTFSSSIAAPIIVAPVNKVIFNSSVNLVISIFLYQFLHTHWRVKLTILTKVFSRVWKKHNMFL